MFFDWISIAFLGILLIAFIVGLSRGFIASLGLAIGALIAIVGAFFLAKPVGEAIMASDWGASMNQEIMDFIQGALKENDHLLAGNLLVPVSEIRANSDLLVIIFDDIGVPPIAREQLANYMLSTLPETGLVVASDAVADGLTIALSSLIAFAIVFAGLFLIFVVVKVVVWAIRHAGRKSPSMLSRLAGGLVKLAEGFIFIYVLAFAISVVSSSVPAANEYLTELLHLGTDDWSFAKWLIEDNAISGWLAAYLAG